MTIEKMTEVPYPGLVPWLAVRKKINEIIEEGTGGEAAWGSITGTLADQTDLKDALDGKADTTDLPAEGELVPDTTGVSNGAVLTKVASGTMWADALPSTGSANAGDVLTLDSNKVAGWSTPAAGGITLSSVSKTWAIPAAAWAAIYDSDGTTVVGYYASTTLIDSNVIGVGFSLQQSDPNCLKYGMILSAYPSTLGIFACAYAKTLPSDTITLYIGGVKYT